MVKNFEVVPLKGSIAFDVYSLEGHKLRVGHVCHFTQSGEDGDFLVTTRDAQYHRFSDRIVPFDSRFQYVDIGAGLGGFTPYLVDEIHVSERPIVIDPVDYGMVREMLLFARTVSQRSDIQGRIDTLVHRCDIYLDPSRVYLVNTTLERAIDEHHEIHGMADIVLDYWAAAVRGDRYRIKELHRILLAPEKSLETNVFANYRR